MFTQLNPLIPVTIVGKGDGYAIGMIDYGQEHSLLWITALDESGEIWCAPNSTVRLQKNWSMGRLQLLKQNGVSTGKNNVRPVVDDDRPTEVCGVGR